MDLVPNSTFGVRQFINLLLALLAFYLRHKPAIDAAIGGSLADAMDTLAAAMEELKDVNEPGPA